MVRQQLDQGAESSGVVRLAPTMLPSGAGQFEIAEQRLKCQAVGTLQASDLSTMGTGPPLRQVLVKNTQQAKDNPCPGALRVTDHPRDRANFTFSMRWAKIAESRNCSSI